MNWYWKLRELAVSKAVETTVGVGAAALFLSAIPEFVFVLATLPRERGW